MMECPVNLAVFDCLSSNGEAHLDLSQRDRLKYIDMHVPMIYHALRFSSETTIQAAYNIAIDSGFEGIMIKDADMSYQAGKRSKGWLKFKPPRISFDVVITSAKYGEGKRSQVYGTYGISVKDGPDFVSVGKCGNGFSDGGVNDQGGGGGEWFNFLPRLVLEVTSELVTTDREGNIGLRFPRCTRIRRDKFAADCDTLESVKEMM